MKKESNKNRYSMLFLASTLGIVLVVSTVVGVMAGVWLDKLAGTKPYLTILFFMFGIAAGVIQIMRELRKLNDKVDKT